MTHHLMKELLTMILFETSGDFNPLQIIQIAQDIPTNTL
jgi:hypothetical protein